MNQNYWIVAVAVVAVTISIVLLIQNNGRLAGVMKMQVEVTYTKTIAIKLNADALYFGRVRPTYSAVRKFNITNNENAVVNVRLITAGEMKDWVSVSENNFRLKAGEQRFIEATVAVPANISEGNYSGKMRVYFS